MLRNRVIVALTVVLASSSFADACPHDEAVKALRALGANVQQRQDNQGNPTTHVTIFAKTWSGSDDDLRHLASLRNLESLSINGLPLTNEAMVHFQFLTSLRALYLRSTKIDDNGLAHLKLLENLQRLGIQGAPVTAEGLKDLKPLKSLRAMWIGGTRINRSKDRAKLKEYCPQVQSW